MQNLGEKLPKIAQFWDLMAILRYLQESDSRDFSMQHVHVQVRQAYVIDYKIYL